MDLGFKQTSCYLFANQIRPPFLVEEIKKIKNVIFKIWRSFSDTVEVRRWPTSTSSPKSHNSSTGPVSSINCTNSHNDVSACLSVASGATISMHTCVCNLIYFSLILCIILLYRHVALDFSFCIYIYSSSG